MKKPSPRSRQSASYRTRHQLDHVVPTVIHDPEEKMTALGRFTHHAMQQPRKYLRWPIALVAGLFLAVVVWKLATGGSSTTSDVWARLETAKTPGERLDLAKEYPTAPAAPWALLQAGTEFYNQALADLPHNRDVALPTAKKALDAFDQVERTAPHDSVPARVAALGKARTLELRNELAKAIEQYEHVVQNWPGTAEAEQAKQYAEALRDPQAAAFYKELYAYSPTKVTLPPMGSETIPPPTPGSPSPDPATNPSATTATPAVPDIPAIEVTPPSVREVRVEPKIPAPKAQPDAKATQPPTKAQPSKPAGSQKDLPDEVFSPK
ncbi:MAG TPA: hypothetical protein VFF52_13515 [Isosphaeraceae bacterium]|nr:hypothetical protein [Isosphaeraceae bacterium]